MLQDREIAVLLYIQKQTASQKMDSVLLNIVFRFCFLYLFIVFELPFIFIRFSNFYTGHIRNKKKIAVILDDMQVLLHNINE